VSASSIRDPLAVVVVREVTLAQLDQVREVVGAVVTCGIPEERTLTRERV
jgi:hypothetical protein